MYLPIADAEINTQALLAIGFCVGVLGGVFGIGGAFMVTPALNILGFPMVYAIGTDLAHILGKSVVAALKHWKLGNVDIKLGLWMIGGTVLGVGIGKEVIMYLDTLGWVDNIVRWSYVILLFSIGCFMVYDYFSFTRHLRNIKKDAVYESTGTRLSRTLQSLNTAPHISLSVSKIHSISIWPIIIVGFFTGFLAGFLGVGGGFIRMPALVYAIGIPTTVAVGTDLFEIIFSAGAGTVMYAMSGKVDIVAAAVMLIGAAVGAQIGTMATKYIKGIKIRLYFGYTVVAAGIAVILKELSYLIKIDCLSDVAAYLILFVSGIMTFVIIIGLLKGSMEET